MLEILQLIVMTLRFRTTVMTTILFWHLLKHFTYLVQVRVPKPIPYRNSFLELSDSDPNLYRWHSWHDYMAGIALILKSQKRKTMLSSRWHGSEKKRWECLFHASASYFIPSCFSISKGTGSLEMKTLHFSTSRLCLGNIKFNTLDVIDRSIYPHLEGT